MDYGKDKKQMSFINHLEELRWVLVRSAIAIVVFALLVFIFIEPIMNYVFLPMADGKFITYRVLCKISMFLGIDDTLCAGSININFQSIEMLSQFSTHVFVSVVGGIVVAFPFIFYQFWSFVKPALKERELKFSKGIIFYSSLLFALGIAFGYILIAPLCVQFFGNYKMVEVIQNNFTINSYMSTITSTTFASGLFFQLPIVVYLLSKMGIVSAVLLKKYRKHALVGVLVLAAFITPPDVISQILVTIPIMILYEISIVISKKVHPDTRKQTN